MIFILHSPPMDPLLYSKFFKGDLVFEGLASSARPYKLNLKRLNDYIDFLRFGPKASFFDPQDGSKPTLLPLKPKSTFDVYHQRYSDIGRCKHIGGLQIFLPKTFSRFDPSSREKPLTTLLCLQFFDRNPKINIEDNTNF